MSEVEMLMCYQDVDQVRVLRTVRGTPMPWLRSGCFLFHLFILNIHRSIACSTPSAWLRRRLSALFEEIASCQWVPTWPDGLRNGLRLFTFALLRTCMKQHAAEDDDVPSTGITVMAELPLCLPNRQSNISHGQQLSTWRTTHARHAVGLHVLVTSAASPRSALWQDAHLPALGSGSHARAAGMCLPLLKIALHV